MQMHMPHTDLRKIYSSSKMKFHVGHNFGGERGWEGEGFHLPKFITSYVS